MNSNNNNNDELIPIKDLFIIILDSKNATNYNNGSFHSDIKFDFEDSIQIKPNIIRCSCSVLTFTCPNSFYTINEYNNILIINNIIYSITKGNYNCQKLMTYLLSILPTGFNITINNITNKFTLSYTSNFTINEKSTIYDVMGFNFNTSYTSTNNILILPYTCNFNGIQSLNINFQI